MDVKTALSLGRVSNLPTVWTNVFVGTALAAGPVRPLQIAGLLSGISLFYVGGMFLNDAFDREYDRKYRPERPIPSGKVSAAQVFFWGLVMLAAGIATVTLTCALGRPGVGFWLPVGSSIVLVALILFYDATHKADPLAPVTMGLIRGMVYVTASLGITVSLQGSTLLAAGTLTAYVIGLTYLARQENFDRVVNLWPVLFVIAPLLYGAPGLQGHPVQIGIYALLTIWVLYCLSMALKPNVGSGIKGAVGGLIAGISLVDALIVASAGQFTLAACLLIGFPLTLMFQKYVAGT
jgi:4-hydroxybenzoate polyprenyltransferase